MAEMELSGKVALVTGGPKRIGKSIALRLAREGADVAVNYRSSGGEAEELVKEIVGMGRKSIAIEADVAIKSHVEKVMGVVGEEFGKLDILVNNAGVFFEAKFEELTEEQWDMAQNTNLKAQFLCAQGALPLLRKASGVASGDAKKPSHIVNLASLGGLLAWPAFTHYCVSKAGVIMLTRCLARALGPEILVNAIAPGTIQFSGEAPDEDYIKRVPVHRTGTGDDIADAVEYLVKANFVTGQVMVVDGGRQLV
jgi:NAD(P)-dependent dehydrogenase (short-subunit alcohol dehydrogenase family)